MIQKDIESARECLRLRDNYISLVLKFCILLKLMCEEFAFFNGRITPDPQHSTLSLPSCCNVVFAEIHNRLALMLSLKPFILCKYCVLRLYTCWRNRQLCPMCTWRGWIWTCSWLKARVSRLDHPRGIRSVETLRERLSRVAKRVQPMRNGLFLDYC